MDSTIEKLLSTAATSKQAMDQIKETERMLRIKRRKEEALRKEAELLKTLEKLGK